jgi:hypothetical protein
MPTKLSTDKISREEITLKIEQVLDRCHGNLEKRRARESHSRLNFACPYCGDSSSDMRKKRGNLYWESLSFHCFNCNKHRDLDAFLRDFDNGFEGEKRLSLVNFLRERATYNIPKTLDFYLFQKIEELAIPKAELFSALNVYPINSNTRRAYPYLQSRLLTHRLENFGYDPKRKTLYVFNFNSDKTKIIGYQTRYLEDSASKYLSYNLFRMREKLNQPEVEINDTDKDSINRISMLFGILQIDLSRIFTIFEGPIDAMFMKNSLALTGVSKSTFNFDELDSVRYMLDNDYEGKRKMVEKLKLGKKVFMWRKFIEENRLSRHKIKDLNDLVKVAYKEKRDVLREINLYFTDNSKDLIYV